MMYVYLAIALLCVFVIGVMIGMGVCKFMVAAMRAQIDEKGHWQDAKDCS